MNNQRPFFQIYVKQDPNLSAVYVKQKFMDKNVFFCLFCCIFYAFMARM